MSRAHPIASSSNFQSVFNAALEAYEKKTSASFSLIPLPPSCSPATPPSPFHLSFKTLSSNLITVAAVLYAFSDSIGQGVSLVLSPANVVFSGIGILLSAAKDIDSSQDVLIDIFVRIETFFKRLESYTEVPPTAAMTDVIVR
ncbi:hypothetical protein F5888DRAFT_1893375 [Russula emetica]|nr:hypothetical protein F5888DRAFT_1893375 [Russula emetica]